MRRIRWTRVALTLALVGLSCQDGAGPDTLRLRVVSGAGQEDTVWAHAPEPLVVEFRDSSGAPRAGVPILFESISAGYNGPRLVLRFTDSSRYGYLSLLDTTDVNGHATADVVFSQSAGIGWVRVSASAFGVTDSARFVVRPGNLARLKLAPADTATLVGHTVTLRAEPSDAWGNPRTEAVEWSTSAGTIEVAAPAQIRGLHTGRGTVHVRVGTLRDSVDINVVPPGRIAAMFYPIAVFEPPYFVVFNTDGTGFQRLDVGADCAHGLQWSPSGDRILFGRNWAPQVCFTERLYSTTMTGAVQKIRPDTAPLAGEYWPRMTADGQWIYFSGRPGHQNGEIWRVRPDGTGAERIGPAAGFYDIDQHPSPSPDGAEVVYASTRETESTINLRVINTATREVRDLGRLGMAPSWSPLGDQIAFIRDGHYYVVASHGSNERPLAASRASAGMPDAPSWSPDENWIVGVVVDPGAYAPLYGRLALIEVATGLVLPLGWTAQLMYPSWRPATP